MGSSRVGFGRADDGARLDVHDYARGRLRLAGAPRAMPTRDSFERALVSAMENEANYRVAERERHFRVGVSSAKHAETLRAVDAEQSFLGADT